ncbi:MAG: hypothetical protein Q9M97_09265 [Candidatus Gracilibacteria bacterium]|nr:hypothetical protein [Candidatus Gracilibacteria bacterium]
MQDEKEMGVRKYLNYGHTFGHALESITDFKLSHGLCVGYGMIYVNILSNTLGYLSDKNLLEINNFILLKINLSIQQGGFSPLQNLDFENIYKKMLSDKKNNSSEISFVLLEKPGILFIENIGKNKKELLKKVFEEFILL